MSEELFYLQDKRQCVGNDMLWWAKESKGYTTDISKAQLFSREFAFSYLDNRSTDIPWPKEYIDARIRPVVDMRHVDHEIAMRGVVVAIKETEA